MDRINDFPKEVLTTNFIVQEAFKRNQLPFTLPVLMLAPDNTVIPIEIGCVEWHNNTLTVVIQYRDGTVIDCLAFDLVNRHDLGDHDLTQYWDEAYGIKIYLDPNPPL